MAERNKEKTRLLIIKTAFKGELVGTINCAGCPTLFAPEKIVDRVHSLVAFGADTIHLSTCLAAACPFKNKYKNIIEQNFPQVKLVTGTHGNLDSDDFKKELAGLKEKVKYGLTAPKQTMPRLMMEQGV